MRGALARVVHTKKLLPMEACLTVIAASTRWGRTGGRVDRSLVSGTTGLQQIGSSARSDVGSKARAAGASGGSNLQQTFDQVPCQLDCIHARPLSDATHTFCVGLGLGF